MKLLKHLLKTNTFTIIFFSTLISCNTQKKPEKVLRSFVHYRFQSHQVKSEILSQTTGKMHSIIQQMDKNDFETFTNLKNYKKKKLKINFKNCDEARCYITYTLSYDQYKNNKKDKLYEVETKKIAELVQSGGEWKISDVSDVKTYFDSQKPINP